MIHRLIFVTDLELKEGPALDFLDDLLENVLVCIYSIFSAKSYLSIFLHLLVKLKQNHSYVFICLKVRNDEACYV